MKSFCVGVVAALAGIALWAGDSPVVTIHIDTPAAEQFRGFGVQWDPYEYPPAEAEWKTTVARLDYMRPAFFRVMWTAAPYCLDFDASGAPQYVWSRDEAEIQKRLGPLFKILDYAQSRGIDVMLGEWSPASMFDGPADPRWARAIAGFVEYLTKQKKYTVIRYYNFFNEPNGNWMWPKYKVDYDAWATGMRALRREFDSRGLTALPIAGPDNSGNWEWLDRCAQELRDQIGFWEMHWYVKDQELLQGDVETLLRSKREMLLSADPKAIDKGLYLGEAGIITGRVNDDQQPRVKDFDYGVLMADLAAQVGRAGWMGASAWDLDDAMHVVNGREHPAVPGDLTLKIWGFWNTQGRSMGHPEDEMVRPWFYTWSLMSRLFPKGSRILTAEEKDMPAGLRTLAAVDEQGVTVMLVNDTSEARNVDVRLEGWHGKKPVAYRYFENDRQVDKNGYPTPHKKATMLVNLPSRGVVFLRELR